VNPASIAARTLLGACLALLAATGAQAQRAGENAVAQASDGFGMSVGHERIGIYSSFNVRGFSPILAGNARIDGLYFDQVTQLNSRLQASSQIRVGIAAQGYAFPAPTGVVDYTLRVPDGADHLSTLTEADTRGEGSAEFDGATRIADSLSLGGGVGFFRPEDASGFSAYLMSEGMLARWTPLPGLEIMPFWSRSDFYDAHTNQNYVPAGPFLPTPNPGRHFLGPDWAINREFDSNYGTLARYRLAEGWEFRGGIFRSARKVPRNYYVEVDGLTLQGNGELNVTADPPTEYGSTSGEVRLEHSFVQGQLSHRITLAFRMRDYNAIYGGSDTRDLGTTVLGEHTGVAKPDFALSAQTHDHIDEIRPGFTYQLAWNTWGTLSFGVQNPHYKKRTEVPGTPTGLIIADPILLNAGLLADLFDGAVFYADFTQGLEDNGIAPQGATNRNQALPAIATKQREVGIRYALTPRVNLVAGYFDIQKPYFNLDAADLYTQLGQIDNQGIELSLDGNLFPRVDVVAGALLSEPKVVGMGVDLGLVGHRPVGIASQRYNVNANWHPPGHDDVTLGMEVSHQSNIVSVLNGQVTVPDKTFVNADMRYSFALDDRAASLRLWVQNIFDYRTWDVTDANTYDIHFLSGRHVALRLIVDM
jgi:iron complex outermembrane recepter protein